jgi:hypothetical protein
MFKAPPVVRFAPPDVISAANPDVKPVALTLRIPDEVVAVFAAIFNTSPVVVIVPVETRDKREPVVIPFAVMSWTTPVVALFATKLTTAAPVNTPVLVTVKAAAEVEEDVMSPRATTAEPPIVVAAGNAAVAAPEKSTG